MNSRKAAFCTVSTDARYLGQYQNEAVAVHV